MLYVFNFLILIKISAGMDSYLKRFSDKWVILIYQHRTKDVNKKMIYMTKYFKKILYKYIVIYLWKKLAWYNLFLLWFIFYQQNIKTKFFFYLAI